MKLNNCERESTYLGDSLNLRLETEEGELHSCLYELSVAWGGGEGYHQKSITKTVLSISEENLVDLCIILRFNG